MTWFDVFSGAVERHPMPAFVVAAATVWFLDSVFDVLKARKK